MDITVIKKVFLYNGEKLENIEGFTNDEILNHYSAFHPEIINAQVRFSEIKDDEEIHIIETKIGHKG